MKKAVLFLCLFFPSLLTFSQVEPDPEKVLNDYNDSLKIILNNLYAAREDSTKLKYNDELLSFLNRMLQLQGSFAYSYPGVKDIGIMISPDYMFRLYNWNIPLEDGTHKYFGFIHKKQIKTRKIGLFKKITTERYEIFPLNDVSEKIANPENYISDNKRWYGMLYYEIIPKKGKNKSVSYTLLGWDGNDKLSKKRIIDILTFNNKGVPVFGGSIFNTEKGIKKRVVFEHSATCTMTLKYNAKKDSIVFDHLVPTEPQMEGQFQYYCTDFTYDGFGFKNGKWNYGEFIRVTNEKTKNDALYRDPKDAENSLKSNTINQEQKKGEVKPEQ